jgi:hypothetical protein
MPVFPEAASMIVIVGCSSPRRSAVSVMCLATRCLVLPPGYSHSALTNILPDDSFFKRIRAVFPVDSGIGWSHAYAFVVSGTRGDSSSRVQMWYEIAAAIAAERCDQRQGDYSEHHLHT